MRVISDDTTKECFITLCVVWFKFSPFLHSISLLATPHGHEPVRGLHWQWLRLRIRVRTASTAPTAGACPDAVWVPQRASRARRPRGSSAARAGAPRLLSPGPSVVRVIQPDVPFLALARGLGFVHLCRHAPGQSGRERERERVCACVFVLGCGWRSSPFMLCTVQLRRCLTRLHPRHPRTPP